MQHYFGKIIDSNVILDDDSLHRLLNVKRSNVNEKIEVVFNEGTYLCYISSIKPLQIKVIEKLNKNVENKTNLAIAFCLLKGDHNEMIVLKGTELGVDSFFPVISKRVVVVPKKEDDNKLNRLKKIAKEGSEQCRRTKIPNVNSYIDFKDVLSLPYQHKIIPYELESGKSNTLYKSLLSHRNESTLILVGPEGGFSEEEVELAIKGGFEPVSLGNRILRAETACLYCASLFSALDNED